MSSEDLGIQAEEMIMKSQEGTEYTPEQFADLALKITESMQDPLARFNIQRLTIASGRYATRELHQFTVYLKDRSNFVISGFDKNDALSRANLSMNLSQQIQKIEAVKPRRKRKS